MRVKLRNLHVFGGLEKGLPRSNNTFPGTIRLCFADFRRLDLIITTPAQLDRLAEWLHNPFFQGVHLLFSRSTLVSERLNQTSSGQFALKRNSAR
jgi:hypothetical protein